MSGHVLNSSFDICILIPCFNNTAGLLNAVNSIVYHPGRYIILIIDDGSDIPVNVETLYQKLSPNVNIVLLRNDVNAGITKALNKGLQHIYQHYHIRYIARLDCGDICSPDRFYEQLNFLDNHLFIDLVGSWCYFKNKQTGTTYKYITPTQHKFIMRSMYFRNVFIHPTVMWRLTSENRFVYPEQYPHAEDYGLFYDIVLNRNTAIIDKFLVTCEINPAGISSSNRMAQMRSRLRIIWRYGTNKWWVAVGSIRLLVVMMLPYRVVYRIKSRLFRA